MKKLSFTSLGIFAVAMVVFSTNTTVSHAEGWKVCGTEHKCNPVSEIKGLGEELACFDFIHDSQEACEEAGKKYWGN